MKSIFYTENLYKSDDVVCFKKTREAFGGLSNMAAGYPIKVNGVPILTSEALYQACRFPHLPDVQKAIISAKSPMAAKMIGKPYRSQSREDFDTVKVDIMRWCLLLKLSQNSMAFGRLLISTKDKDIVEDSHNDRFWGAVLDNETPEILRGCNVLGKLLIELRELYKDNRNAPQLLIIEPLDLSNFMLYGKPIETIKKTL